MSGRLKGEGLFQLQQQAKRHEFGIYIRNGREFPRQSIESIKRWKRKQDLVQKYRRTN